MTSETQDFLYKLLPAFYQQLDKENGEPLRALMAIFENELQLIEAEIDKSYNNCFAETCELTTLSLIASLLNITDLQDLKEISPAQRRRITNTIRYRRRKGIANVLEQVAQDMSGWSTKLVEYFKLIGITQNIIYPHLNQGRIVSIRDVDAIEMLNTPFDRNAHTIEVRNPKYRHVKYSTSSVGLFVWRVQSYFMKGVVAKKLNPAMYRYTFNPLGRDSILFNRTQLISDITQKEKEINVPTPIRLAALQLDLKNNTPSLYGAESDTNKPSINIVKVLNDNSRPAILPGDIVAIDLSSWGLPSTATSNMIFIDPLLGRIALPPNANSDINRLEVNYCYGFGADLGGGPYHRTVAQLKSDDNTYTVSVAKQPVGGGSVTTISNAITNWVNSNKPKCIIQIEDNATYDDETIDTDKLTNKESLIIQAADGNRPLLISLTINAPVAQNEEAVKIVDVNLSGLMIKEAFYIKGDMRLTVQHCTLVPNSNPSISVKVADIGKAKRLEVIIENTISGAIYLPAEMPALTISDSIIDAFGRTAIAADKDALKPAPQLQLERTTVLGSIYTAALADLSESIITQPVIVNNLQTGCVRYSFLPLDSQTPARYRCEPELSAAPLLRQKAKDLNLADIKNIPQEAVELILKPFFSRFISTKYGDPYYAQLSPACSVGILTGAENSSEMGVYQKINFTRNAMNVSQALKEYLPNGNEAFIEFADIFSTRLDEEVLPADLRVTMSGDERVTQASEKRVLEY